MADRIRFSVNITPIETLTDENSGTHDIVASEVNRSLGGSGDSIDITNYAGTAANQGYLNATVNYKIASHSAGGTKLSATEGDFVFIKNTGFKFSDATTLGDSTTDCVMVVLRTNEYTSGVQNGWALAGDSGEIHYFELGWLKPGQAMILPAAANNLSISQFGSNAGDLTILQNGDNDANGTSEIYIRTFLSTGGAAASENAIEYLVVT